MTNTTCRDGCGACCIAPSITQPFPGMPNGKPAGVPCANLEPATKRCRIWETADYPNVCRHFKPEAAICGNSAEEALRILEDLEKRTSFSRTGSALANG